MRKSLTFKKGQWISVRDAQRLALVTGTKGAGFVSPNPLVGCVVVDKGHRFLSAGYHPRCGQPHAEIFALQNLTESELKGGTMYVTLEPCSHYGRTPPCAEKIITTPLRHVVIGAMDPNPLVSGRGRELLENNGILTTQDPWFTKKSELLCEVFLYNMEMQLPFVALKVATSADGKMALLNGESQWITSEEARLHSRHLRAHYDATMIGAKTLLHDRPRLDFRGTSFDGKKANKIIIYDPRGYLDKKVEQMDIAKIHGAENIFILSPNKIHSSRLQHVPMAKGEGLSQNMLEALFKREIRSIFVEGGAYTHSQFLKTSFVQKIFHYMSPDILGRGQSWSDQFEIKNLKEKKQMRISYSKSIGRDLLVVSRPF